MSLPNSYSGKIPIEVPKEIDKQMIVRNFSVVIQKNQMIKKFTCTTERIEFTIQPFLAIQYHTVIEIEQQDRINLAYEIKLNRLIQVSIALIIFIAFFSSFRMTGFLWFSTIFTIAFYAINVMIADSQVRNLIKSVVKNQEKGGNEELLSPEQMQWIKDKAKCPACGEDITEYDLICPECGIKLRENAPPAPYDISKKYKKRIKYFFKEKKK